jgi:hypothetical protein
VAQGVGSELKKKKHCKKKGRKEILTHATIQMKLEISQSEKDKYCMSPFM